VRRPEKFGHSESVNQSDCANYARSPSPDKWHDVDHRDKPGDDELFEICILFVMAGLVPAIHVGKPTWKPAALADTFTRSQSSDMFQRLEFLRRSVAERLLDTSTIAGPPDAHEDVRSCLLPGSDVAVMDRLVSRRAEQALATALSWRLPCRPVSYAIRARPRSASGRR
jgi:hypothetical protein